MVGKNTFTLYHWPRGYMSMKGRLLALTSIFALMAGGNTDGRSGNNHSRSDFSLKEINKNREHYTTFYEKLLLTRGVKKWRCANTYVLAINRKNAVRKAKLYYDTDEVRLITN